MRRIGAWLKTGLFFAGFTLLALSGFLVFAVPAVALRPLLILTFLVAVLGSLVLSHFSPGFRDWLDLEGGPERHVTERST